MYICIVIIVVTMAARQSGLIFLVMVLFSVFYLVGGSTNFVCQSLVGRFSFEDAQKEVANLNKMGYKAMAVKNGHIIGGYCSYSDFANTQLAKEYYAAL